MLLVLGTHAIIYQVCSRILNTKFLFYTNLWINQHSLRNSRRICKSRAYLNHCLLCKSPYEQLHFFIWLSYYLHNLLFIQVNVSTGLLNGLFLKLDLLCNSPNVIKCVMIKIYGVKLCKTLLCFAFVNLMNVMI